MPKKKTKVSGEPLYYSGNIPEITIQGNTPLKRIRRGYLDDMYDVVPNDAIRTRNLGIAPGQSKRDLESQAAARAIAARSNEYPIFDDGELVGFSPSYREALAQNDRPLSPADPVGEFIVSGAALGKPLQAIGRGAQWALGRAGNQWARNRIVGRAFRESPIYNNNTIINTVTPKVRTKVGDVEIDNPYLLYHIDRGNYKGLFSNRGAYIKEGKLYPGPVKNGKIPYSWWNKGEPYAIQVHGFNRAERLITATPDDFGMLHVRSQNYPIGQWNGKKGFVLNSEYVNSNPVNIKNNVYVYDPLYGYRKVTTSPKASLAFYERPSKLSVLEKAGAPKNVRDLYKRTEPYRNNAVSYYDTALGDNLNHLRDLEMLDSHRGFVANPWKLDAFEPKVKPSWYRRNNVIYERPNNLTYSERLGLPKNERIPNRHMHIGEKLNLKRMESLSEGKFTDKARRGEGAWSIANRNGMTLKEFYELNPSAKNGVYTGDEFIVKRPKKRNGGYIRRLESGGRLSY